MKRIVLIGVVCAMATACASGLGFNPRTTAGAQCKKDAAFALARCDGSSYTCDRAAATMIAACQDVDRVAQ